MKKTLVLLTALALLTFTACISKDATNQLQQTVKITGNLITNETSTFVTNSHPDVTINYTIADGVLTVKGLAKIVETKPYPWSYVNVDTGKALTGVTSVKFSYKSDKTITIKFRQPNLKDLKDENGVIVKDANGNDGTDQYFAYDLPSTEGVNKDVTILVTDFKLPDWVGADILKYAKLQLDNVTSLDLCPLSVRDGLEHSFTISNLELIY